MVGDPVFANENPDYLLISKHVVPALLEAGASHEHIAQMMIENPQRFFAGATTPAPEPVHAPAPIDDTVSTNV